MSGSWGESRLDDIYDPITGELLVKANDEINEAKVEKVEGAGLEKVHNPIRAHLSAPSVGYARSVTAVIWPMATK